MNTRDTVAGDTPARAATSRIDTAPPGTAELCNVGAAVAVSGRSARELLLAVLDDEAVGVLAGFLAGTREVAVRILQQLHEPLARERLATEAGSLLHASRLPARGPGVQPLSATASSLANTRAAARSSRVMSPTHRPSTVRIPNARASVATGTAMNVR